MLALQGQVTPSQLELVDEHSPRRRPVAKLVVVIPALNESATIGQVVSSVPRVIAGVGRVDVIVVDDGSTDSTQVEAVAAGADAVLFHPRRRGLVPTFKQGVEHALRLGADIVVTLDGDGQHDPREIPNVIAPLVNGDADIALGVRRLTQATEIHRGRRYGNIAGSRLASMALGVPISDATSGYRAFTRESMLRLNVVSQYTYTLETLIEAARKHLSVAEVPIDVSPRVAGQSRMTHSIVRYIRRSGGQAASAILRHHLAAVLGRLAAAAFLVALVTTAWFLWSYHVDGAGRHLPLLLASVLSALACMGLAVSGLLAAGIDSSRRLTEDALYHIRCVELAWDGTERRRAER
jgi:Glycosyl transferase family 2